MFQCFLDPHDNLRRMLLLLLLELSVVLGMAPYFPKTIPLSFFCTALLKKRQLVERRLHERCNLVDAVLYG